MKKNSDDIDSVLIKKAKNGNEGAFSILVNKYHPRVYASLFSFTKSKEDSEDLSQQTFIKVWQQLSSLGAKAPFLHGCIELRSILLKTMYQALHIKNKKLAAPLNF